MNWSLPSTECGCEAFVDRLRLVELAFGKALPAVTGRPAYDPADLLKLFLNG